MKYFRIIILAFFCLFLHANAQETSPTVQKLSLQQAIDLAKENNIQLTEIRNNSLIANAQNSLGYNGYLPLIFLESGFNSRNEDVNQRFVTGQEQIRNNAITSQLTSTLGIDYVVYNGFRNKAQKGTAKANYDLINAQIKATENDIENQVTEYYYLLVVNNDLISLYKDALRLSKLKLNIAELKVSIGSGTRLDMLSALTNYQNDSVQYLKQLADQNTINLPFSNLINPESWVTYMPIDTDIVLTKIIDINVSKSSELETYKQDVLLKANNLKLIGSNLQPSLTLTGRYNYSMVNSQAGFLERSRTNGLSAGVAFRWNIFDGLKQATNTQIALINYKTANARYLEAEKRLERQYQALKQQFTRYVNLIVLQTNTIVLAKENVELAQELYKTGRTDIVFVREAELNYIQTKQNYFNNLLTAKLLELKIEKLGK